LNTLNLSRALKRSLAKSRPSIPTKSLVKLIHINPELNDIINEKLSIIFIHYQKAIFIPDFNICTLLKMINSNIDIDIIQDYVRIYIFNIYIQNVIFSRL